MIEIPPVFLDRMQHLLGDAYPAFVESYNRPPVNGLRVNTLKISPQRLRERLPGSPWLLKPVAGIPAGFRLPEEAMIQNGAPFAPGKHPYHAAGLYYLQEPSAMSVAELLAPQPGEAVLDVCAAPGGKSTHMAALMENEGLLVANEIHPHRVWELAENLERWGVRNAVVTNASPERLSQQFGPIFDRVLVDAPCSGEGMFRKSELARREWSPELGQFCWARQQALLDQAVLLVRPGGWLAYSTCTFNPQENEQVIANFLDAHPHFDLVEGASIQGSEKGQPEWVSGEKTFPSLAKATRFWPQSFPGEGHFVALLRHIGSGEWSGLAHKREDTPGKPARRARHKQADLPQPMLAAWRQFIRSTLQGANLDQLTGMQPLRRVGSYLYLLPDGLPDLTGINVIHPGLWLGSFKTSSRNEGVRFEPAHALAMALDSGTGSIPDERSTAQSTREGGIIPIWGIGCRQTLHLGLDEPGLYQYLRGESLELRQEQVVFDPGWVLVMVEGYPLGWGKLAQGRLKNYYPRGLRWL